MNEDVQASGRTFTRQVDRLPAGEVVAEIASKVDLHKLEDTMMVEGFKKFADPQKAPLALLAEKRAPFRAAAGVT